MAARAGVEQGRGSGVEQGRGAGVEQGRGVTVGQGQGAAHNLSKRKQFTMKYFKCIFSNLFFRFMIGI